MRKLFYLGRFRNDLPHYLATMVAFMITTVRREEREKSHASEGNRTPVDCLEGNHADHYTTDALQSHSLNLHIQQ
uniref:Uncharacterized protein n=1 Tax=Steinernema glaseri TaxID=37863 RepID=A0A1I7YV29_9BILA